jgi:endoglucanase
VTRAAAGAVPVIVAYNIPGRDCGSYSQGGANGAAAYRRWVGRLARGIAGRTAVVIVEPDAGHSHWQPARTMATRLRRAGVGKADGFALNVSNYRTNPELIAYTRQIGSWHYVIDTSRNGQGPWTGEQEPAGPRPRRAAHHADGHAEARCRRSSYRRITYSVAGSNR